MTCLRVRAITCSACAALQQCCANAELLMKISHPLLLHPSSCTRCTSYQQLSKRIRNSRAVRRAPRSSRRERTRPGERTRSAALQLTARMASTGCGLHEEDFDDDDHGPILAAAGPASAKATAAPQGDGHQCSSAAGGGACQRQDAGGCGGDGAGASGGGACQRHHDKQQQQQQQRPQGSWARAAITLGDGTLVTTAAAGTRPQCSKCKAQPAVVSALRIGAAWPGAELAVENCSVFGAKRPACRRSMCGTERRRARPAWTPPSSPRCGLVTWAARFRSLQ